MSAPLAVVISDIHFTVATLELASAALRQARRKAAELGVPLFIAGDTLDSKAIMRGECVNRLLQIFQEHPYPKYTKILVGNHDLINEKGKEHTLNFLNLLPGIEVVSEPTKDMCTDVLLIPYQQEGSRVWTQWLQEYRAGQKILIHQGVTGGQMGHYFQDASAIDTSILTSYISLGGHYHNHHTVGPHTFIGNPYSLTFGEVNDHAKGFVVWNKDGSVTHVPTNLRRHLIYDAPLDALEDPQFAQHARPDDLVWLKIHGPATELDKIQKKALGLRLFGHSNFKLDKIYTDRKVQEAPKPDVSNAELLDSIIDQTQEAAGQLTYLKNLWREVLHDSR